MRINLNIPFTDKNKAKQLGCRWDSFAKTWYVINPQNIECLLQWCPERLKTATKSEPLKHSVFDVVQPRTKQKKQRFTNK